MLVNRGRPLIPHLRCLIRPRLNQITVFAFVQAFMIQPSNPLELAHPIAERSPGPALSWRPCLEPWFLASLSLSLQAGDWGDWGENGGTPWVVIHDESGARPSASTSVSGACVVRFLLSLIILSSRSFHHARRKHGWLSRKWLQLPRHPRAVDTYYVVVSREESLAFCHDASPSGPIPDCRYVSEESPSRFRCCSHPRLRRKKVL